MNCYHDRDHVKLALVDSKGPFSSVIKWRFGGPFSHTALLLDNTTIQEATFQGGVHKASLKSLKARSNSGIIVKVPVKNRDSVFALADLIDGAPYDFKGALGIGFNRNWQESSDYWCSEANYFCIHGAGNEYYRKESLTFIAPIHLYMLNFEIVERF